jgi:hypothetical protein
MEHRPPVCDNDDERYGDDLEMAFRAIDDQREMLVDFYVSDAVRGVENPGLRPDEIEALRLVLGYEREREHPAAGDGLTFAASRMLDNVYGADDGPHEMARYMASDLAFQRHAAEVVAAADLFEKDGTPPTPGRWDEVYEKYVLPDIISDPDARSDWVAMSEGRFHDVSDMSIQIVEEGVKDFDHLPKEDRSWFYDNEKREEEEYVPRLSGMIDALQMADALAETENEPRTAPEAAKDLARELDEQGYHTVETSDRTDFTKLVIEREGGFTEAEVTDIRNFTANFDYVIDEIRLTRQGHITVDVRADDDRSQETHEITGRDVAEWLEGEPARHEWSEEERAAQIGGYLGRFRYDAMMEEGRDKSALIAYVAEMEADGPRGVDHLKAGADRLGIMIDQNDSRADHLARSLAEGVMGHVGIGAGPAEYWNMMEGQVMPLREMLSNIEREDRGESVLKSVEAVMPKDEAGYEAFEAVRMDVATGPQEDDYQPFTRPDADRMQIAERELGTVRDAIRYEDATIGVDDGLYRAVLLLKDAGLPLTPASEPRLDAIERAFARADMHETQVGSMSPNEKARMIAYDVATQEEARGLLMGASGKPTDISRGAALAKPAEALVARMGIRTLTQEKLADVDLRMIANGRFEEVSAYHKAGLHLGTTWAREGLKGHELIDERMERLVHGSTMDAFSDRAGKGLTSMSASVADPAPGVEAVRGEGGIASQARTLEPSEASKAKGTRDTDGVMLQDILNVRDGGRG